MHRKYLFPWAILVMIPFLFHSVSAQINGGRVGIIGLDTSHSIEFAKILNDSAAALDSAGYRVIAAYPQGSRDIPSSIERIPGYTEQMRTMGVEICASIEELLASVDVVLLETNDGRLHWQQALAVFKAGKPVFIDKPVTASLADAIAIYDAAGYYKIPVFSSSSLRYMKNAQAIRNGSIGAVVGADAYSPAHLEKTHPDLFWYGIHGVETLFTVMGTGCERVVRIHTDGTDVVVGTWKDGRIGTFRGLRDGQLDYGGMAFGTTGVAAMGPYDGYRPLIAEIVRFFRSGIAPVSAAETLEIYAFMEAADESRRQGGIPIKIDSVMSKARKEAKKIFIHAIAGTEKKVIN
jgi:hypothetical protein